MATKGTFIIYLRSVIYFLRLHDYWSSCARGNPTRRASTSLFLPHTKQSYLIPTVFKYQATSYPKSTSVLWLYYKIALEKIVVPKDGYKT